MNYIRVILSAPGTYNYNEASNIEMTILGHFFSTDVRCDDNNGWRNWAFFSPDGAAATGNITELEKEMDTIILSDQYSEEPISTRLKMTTEQFVKLCDEWQTKVVAHKPIVVIIKHENGQFTIETSNENDALGFSQIIKNPHGIYTHERSTSLEMAQLGRFFTENVGPRGSNSFRNWVADPQCLSRVTGNRGTLEKKENHIMLTFSVELYPGGFFPIKIKMTIDQCVQLCDEWQAKVVTLKPNVVIMKHENGQFTIETSNEPSNRPLP